MLAQRIESRHFDRNPGSLEPGPCTYRQEKKNHAIPTGGRFPFLVDSQRRMIN
jgi:hypothetical protein